MADMKRLIAAIGCREGQAVLPANGTVCTRSFQELAHDYNNNGADELMIFDRSESDEDHEKTIGLVKEIAREIDIPILLGGRIKRLEDVKKYLYAGAKAVFLDGSSDDNIDLIREASNRFGNEKILVLLSGTEQLARVSEFAQLGASAVILNPGDTPEFPELPVPLYLITEDRSIGNLNQLLQQEAVAGVILMDTEHDSDSCMDLKQALSCSGIPMDIMTSSIRWEDFRPNAHGLMPVIVQDYKTSEVLMLAYMNQQAFEDTLRTGKMHYYSRSRKTQWLKGETSGHFQYVKSLHLDCDNDTILAKVHQIGAACHTGSQSCFFQTLAEKEYRETNPLKVFEDVFAVIQDRKVHPKEGSYTNYLFEKGIDKILKKVGEEATEIVIAAKNPDPEEIKYEISDFLYHVMVLMAEKGVTWEEITRELANR